MLQNFSVCGCLCDCSMPCPYVEVCTYTIRLVKSYIYVPIAVKRQDATWDVFESVRRRLQCNPLCLAMLNRTKNFIYWCFALSSTRFQKINSWCVQVNWASPCNEPNSPCIHAAAKKNLWVFLSRAALCGAGNADIDSLEKDWQKICPERLASRLNYLISSKLYQF